MIELILFLDENKSYTSPSPETFILTSNWISLQSFPPVQWAFINFPTLTFPQRWLEVVWASGLHASQTRNAFLNLHSTQCRPVLIEISQYPTTSRFISTFPPFSISRHCLSLWLLSLVAKWSRQPSVRTLQNANCWGKVTEEACCFHARVVVGITSGAAIEFSGSSGGKTSEEFWKEPKVFCEDHRHFSEGFHQPFSCDWISHQAQLEMDLARDQLRRYFEGSQKCFNESGKYFFSEEWHTFSLRLTSKRSMNGLANLRYIVFLHEHFHRRSRGRTEFKSWEN